jgi:hypothetical protein
LPKNARQPASGWWSSIGETPRVPSRPPRRNARPWHRARRRRIDVHLALPADRAGRAVADRKLAAEPVRNVRLRWLAAKNTGPSPSAGNPWFCRTALALLVLAEQAPLLLRPSGPVTMTDTPPNRKSICRGGCIAEGRKVWRFETPFGIRQEIVNPAVAQATSTIAPFCEARTIIASEPSSAVMSLPPAG